MNLQSIARAYTACAELEEKARFESDGLAEDLSVLRAELHALLMETLREHKIPFSDRADAARLAYELAAKHQAA